MARSRKVFWTRERLKELEYLFSRHTPSYLVRHFGKPFNLLCLAYEHAILHRKLKIMSRQKGKKRVTVYAPGYAEGAEPSPMFHSRAMF